MNGTGERLWTVREVLRAAADLLASRGVEAPQLEAQWLLAHALGLERLALFLQMDRPLTDDERSRYRALLRRRGDREPCAYIVGRWSFYGLVLELDPSVLIPRPETEILVDLAIERLRARARPARVADIGTGSGAIAIAVAKCTGEPAPEHVVASDVSADALRVAARNVARHGLEDRIELRQGDLYAPLGPERGRIDLLLSNPPYVAESWRSRLQPEVAREPARALFAGPDGLAVIRRLLAEAPAVLAPGGHLLVEIGYDQAQAASRLAQAAGLVNVRVHPDLAGRARVLEGRRSD